MKTKDYIFYIFIITLTTGGLYKITDIVGLNTYPLIQFFVVSFTNMFIGGSLMCYMRK